MGGERPLRLMGTGRLAGNVPLTRNLTGNENTVRRGQDPALRLYGNCEQNRKYQFPSGRRGGVYAARAILSCRERAVLYPRSRTL